MNKIRIIDLLNMISKGEEAPKKIFYGDQYWINKYPNDYEGLGYGGCLLNNVCLNQLNDKVEVIEEDKKIREICTFLGLDDDKYAYEDGNKPNNVKINNKIEELLIDKINELVKEVNKLKNKEK